MTFLNPYREHSFAARGIHASAEAAKRRSRQPAGEFSRSASAFGHTEQLFMR